MLKNFYSDLSENLLSKLPPASNRYGEQYLKNFYQDLNLKADSFEFSKVSEADVLTLLNDVDLTKASGIDNIGGHFIKDGAKVLARPICQLCNLSISLSTFPSSCKIAKVIPLF